MTGLIIVFQKEAICLRKHLHSSRDALLTHSIFAADFPMYIRQQEAAQQQQQQQQQQPGVARRPPKSGNGDCVIS